MEYHFAFIRQGALMELDDIYDLVIDSVRQALVEENGGGDIQISARMSGGHVIFEDGDARVLKDLPVATVFKKVTSVREKLRVLEQKINNHPSLDPAEVAELQAYISKCYGSLTTFNFLFRDEEDEFRGTGG